MRPTLKTFLTVSALVVLAAGVGSLFLRTIAKELFGIEEILPSPAVHLRPDVVFQVGPLPVTNTLLSSWLVTLVLATILGLAMGPAGRVFPSLKTAVDLLLETLLELFKAVAGESRSYLAFSFIATLFLFITANAWVALFPIYGPIVVDQQGVEQAVPILRGAGTDINMPLALAMVAGVFVELRAIRVHGLDYLRRIFPIHTIRRRRLTVGVGSMYLAMLHNITHIARLFSFTFRLFGALTAGELLRLIISFLTPLLLVIPFYGLEIMLGLLQAFVFAGLTLVLMVVAERKEGDLWTSSE